MSNEEIEKLKQRYYELDDLVKSLDVAQLAFKTASNSFYGVTGLAHFRYYDYRLAEAITTTGQIAIKKSKQIIDDAFSTILNNKKDYVIYCDTDSSYVNIQDLVEKYCKEKTNAEIVDYVEKFITNIVQPQLNKKLSKITQSMGIDNCLLDMKLECIGPSIIMCCHPHTLIETANGKRTIESLWVDNGSDNFSPNHYSVIGFDMDKKKFYINNTQTIMRRKYSGYLITIETESGNILKLTPNHPALVTRDKKQIWVNASDLKETDNVVEYS